MDFRSYLIAYIILLGLQSSFSINFLEQSQFAPSKPCPPNMSGANCICHISPEGNYKYDCDSIDGNQILIDLEPHKHLQFVCGANVNMSVYDLLPNLHDLDTYEGAYFMTCPLNESITFRDIFDRLGVKHVNVLRYITFGQFPEMTFTRRTLAGLNLTKLSLIENEDGIKFDPDFLIDQNRMENLNLFGNNVKLTPHFFQGNKNLTFLELGHNGIVELPQGIFSNLTKLEILNLQKNQLSDLKTEFANLVRLISLNLNENHLVEISENVFSNLTKLEEVTLNMNDFKYLPGKLFENNKELRRVTLNQNGYYLQLGSGLFSNLPSLRTVEIKDSNIMRELPEDLFWNSLNITNISLTGNSELDVLPELLLRDSVNLYSLDLSSNSLKTLSNNLLSTTVDLHILNLSHNQLRIIPSDSFHNLGQLREIILNSNKIFSIGLDTFKRTSKIEAIYLANNEITFQDLNQQLSTTPFSVGQTLKILDLANNSINRVENEWRITQPHLTLLNLSYNQIQEIEFITGFIFTSRPITVDLRHNRIETVDMKRAKNQFVPSEGNLDAISGGKDNIKILLGYNPITCDCRIYDLLRYFEGKLDPEVLALVEINSDNLICSSPKENQDKKITSISSLYVSCDFHTNCPDKCHCSGRYSDDSVVVNCSNSGLTELPKQLPPSKEFSNVILDVSHNRIPNFKMNETLANSSRYQALIELDLSYNNISDITWLPPKLQVLEIHSNNFATINVTLLRSISSLRLISLYWNPWKCDCINLDLLSYVQDEIKRLPHAVRIKCDERQILTSMTSDELCPFPLKAVISLAVFFVVLSSLVTLLLIVYYRNETEIKVWLFTHGYCLWWIGEDELDKDKKYDAFISYSFKDRDFVVKQLVPNLEQKGEKTFKLCIDERDWMAGETIPNQIANSVLNSRRTIVVLSPNFLESVWGKMEFRSAHRTALEDGQARVIVIKLAEIGDLEKIDPELRAYLKMNTYIAWSEKNFWNKLRYALPHPPKLSKRAALISQHINKSLNDKTELIHKSQPITSTPPAESIDNDPLMFKDGVINPLALQIQIGENKIIV